ncbi:MAG: prepilin-type N-terminal cleavage/methylation domain-containing protein [Burkholderiaceae bacterium]|jgi:type IV pilus assembly protein PilV|nr:prepilin-type N-terminal cleavage/methylation domain-containing protein [Burkholderiaceae bacterium]
MRPKRFAAQRGFSLIEILITLVITAFGLLGLAAFAAKSTQLGVDATQRARAAALLNDMTSRVANNKPNAALYASATVHGAPPVQVCAAGAAPAQVVARDLCEWGNLLAGANDGGANSAFLGYRGCVTQPDPLQPVFVITVAWGSLTPGIPPADLCAQGAFGDDSQRRIIRSQVRVAALAA